MNGICCFAKLKNSNTKFQTLKMRPAMSLGPLFVINTSFRSFKLFCLFLRVKYGFEAAPSFFSIQEYRIAAILKKWRPFPDFMWLTCFFDKIVPKDSFFKISCLHHKLKDF